MYQKISPIKFLRNIVGVMLLGGLCFGVIGLLLAGSTGLIYMAMIGAVVSGVGCLAMQVSVIFEVRSWQYTVAHELTKLEKAAPWFIKREPKAKPSNP